MFGKRNWVCGPGCFLDADAGGISGIGDTHAAGNGGKTLTQEQVSALVGAARKEGRESGIAKILKDLGADDLDGLKNLVEAAKNAESASKSDIQNLADQLAAAQKKNAELEASAARQLAAIQERLLISEIKIAASRPVIGKDGKATRPAFHADILDDIGLLIDRALIVEKNGKYEGVEMALEDLARKKPILLAQAEGNGARPRGTPGAAGHQKQEIQEQRPAAAKSKSIFN